MVARLIALLLCSLPALAVADDAAAVAADRQQRRERAAALHGEAAEQRARADALLASQQADCAKRFFVTACRDEAKAEHLRTMLEVRRLEGESDVLEREVKREEALERERQREADLQRRDSELPAREAAVAAERKATDEAIAKRLAEKERRAAEGARRKAAEAEKQRQKQADHDARVAKKKQQAERQ